MYRSLRGLRVLSFLLGKTLGVEWLDHRERHLANSLKSHETVLQSGYTLLHPPEQGTRVPGPPHLTDMWCGRFQMLSVPVVRNGTSLCFPLGFPSKQTVPDIFPVLISHPNIHCDKGSVYLLPTFSVGLLVLLLSFGNSLYLLNTSSFFRSLFI